MNQRIYKTIFFSAIAVYTLYSCAQTSLNIKPAQVIDGKASAIQLGIDTTVINPNDWVLDLNQIDSITATEGLSIHQSGFKLKLIGAINDPLGNLSLWSGNSHDDILLKRSKKEKVTLQYSGSEKNIRVKGEFNAWNVGEGEFKATEDGLIYNTYLNPGLYQYLFVINGIEMRDPSNPDSVDNGIGGWNSLLKIEGTNKSTLPSLSTSKYADSDITLESNNKLKGVFCYWNNTLIDGLINIRANKIEIGIPNAAKEVKRSTLRVWAYNDSGASEEVLIPLEYGKVLNDVNQISREDKESNIMYFLMVDRFYNGNKTNDEPVDDRSIHPKANFFGGDIAGVNKKIESGYFSKLGVNTIWLSPIAQNPLGAYGKYPDPLTTFSGYHGYWPISSSEVDYRFGSENELKNLVDQSHKSDFNIILDYVANHIHKEHPVYQNNPDWVTNLYLPDGTLNTEKWDEHRLTTWFDTFLPTLDLSKPEVVEPMTDSALFWLEKYNIDGFRHDATKHIPLIFWRELTKKVKSKVIIPKNKSVLQIGETYGSRELISSYISTGMLDGQFDFNLYDDAVATFAREDVPFSRLVNSLKESINYYGLHNLMGNITGNQDRARFISYADKSVRFDEDAKKAGWTRDIALQDTLAYRKLASLTAFMMTIPGIPVIYYGDEIGLPGGNDPDNRRMMIFDGLDTHQNKHLEMITKVINFRKSNLANIYGDLEIVHTSDELLIIKRKYFNNETIAIFNKASNSIQVDLQDYKIDLNGYNTAISNKKNNASKLSIDEYSFEMLSKN